MPYHALHPLGKLIFEPVEDDDDEEREILETKIFPRTLASFGVGDGTV